MQKKHGGPLYCKFTDDGHRVWRPSIVVNLFAGRSRSQDHICSRYSHEINWCNLHLRTLILDFIMKALAFIIVGVAFLLLSTGVPGGAQGTAEPRENTGPPESPISIEPSSSKVTISAAVASERAAAIAGVASVLTANAARVMFEDANPFGFRKNTDAWLFDTPLTISTDSSEVEIDMSVVVDGESGKVVAVFSKSRDTWLLPAGRRQNPQDMAEVVWDFDSEIPQQMQSSAADVLVSLGTRGIDPGKAGQIILRPRWVQPIAQVEIVDHQVVPKSIPRYQAWVAQVCGVRAGELPTRDGTKVYASGMIVLFRDGIWRDGTLAAEAIIPVP